MARSEPDLARLTEACDLRTKDPERSVREFEALANSGSVRSMNYLGEAYRFGIGVAVDLQRAETWFVRAAECGHSVAANQLGGVRLKLGKHQEALEAFKVAAAGNNMLAMTMLGYMYRKGIGTSKNLDAARDWYERASALGQLVARGQLGSVLIFGHFGLREKLRGAKLILQADREAFALAKKNPRDIRLRGALPNFLPTTMKKWVLGPKLNSRP